MANDIRGEVSFEALDQEWTLKLGNGAVRHIENETGKTFTQVGRELSDPEQSTITLLTLVFRAALLRHHPDATMEDCDDIIDDVGHEQAGNMLGKAFELMQPKPAKAGASRPKKATAR